MFTTVKEAVDYVGGFSSPGKMPCFGYSIPPQECKTGMKLRQVKNSICSVCYAFRGNYPFPVVKNAMARRFASLKDLPKWTEAMVVAIGGTEGSGFFRWHDAGDIQSLEHLEAINQIAKRLPHIKFWLPTREYSFVSEFVEKHKSFSSNLIVRLSAYMVEGKPPIELAKRLGVLTSGVSKVGFTCPASSQGNKCLSCRSCWDSNVPNVNYKRH